MKALTILGLCLSLVGIFLGGWALIDTRRTHSSRPLLPWWGPFRTWFLVRVLRSRRDGTVQSVGAAASLGFAGSLEALVIPAQDAPVERQIAYLREQVDSLRNKIGEESQARQKAMDAAYEKLSASDEVIRTDLRALQDKTEALAADSTWQQLWGLVLVGMGTVCLALPPLLGLQ